MTPAADIPLKEPTVSAAAGDADQLERARIDASTRVPVVMVYGWASMVAMGTAIWLMARLCRTTLRHPLIIVTGIWFWNIGVVIGVIGILMGYSTGYDWLEFPPYAAVVLFVAYALIISWAVLMFRFRRGDQIYITQWYLLAAFLWFPWLYAVAQAMLFVFPARGLM